MTISSSLVENITPAWVEREVVHNSSRHELGDPSFLCHLSASWARLLVEVLRCVRMHVEHHHIDLIGHEMAINKGQLTLSK